MIWALGDNYSTATHGSGLVSLVHASIEFPLYMAALHPLLIFNFN